MRASLYLLIISCYLSDFRIFYESIGRAGAFFHALPELISGLIGIWVLLVIAKRSRLEVPVHYVILGLFLVLVIIVGAIVNNVAIVNVLLGLREFFRYLPIFFVPIVYKFTNEELRRLLIFILVLSVFQLPVAVIQFVYYVMLGGSYYPGHYTGDMVRGMLDNSGVLAIYLCSVATMMLAYVLRGMIKPWVYGLLTLFVLAPLTLNETKGTVILLLAGIGVVGWGSSRLYGSVKPVFIAGSVSIVILAAFIGIYDRVYEKEGGLLGFYFGNTTDSADRYLNLRKRKTVQVPKNVGTYTRGPDVLPDEVGRFDSIHYAYERMSKRGLPMLLLGAGLGNTSTTLKDMKGAFGEEAGVFGIYLTTIANVLWNLGFMGIVLLAAFFWFVWIDTQRLQQEEGTVGTLALGWSGVLAIFTVSLLYKNVIPHAAIAVLFMFFCGYIAHARFALGSQHTNQGSG